jgi:hypothetical protein
MARQLVVTIVWICFAAGCLFPQEAGNTAGRLALPGGNGSWVIRISTSGGFSGAGKGNIAVSSNGDIVCTMQKPACPERFDKQPIQNLVDKLTGAKLTSTVAGSAPVIRGLCNDCLNSRLEIVWRDAVGIEHSHSSSWDELTAATAPPEVIDIYNAIIALRK